jgi:hypothetical protein
MLGGGGIPGGFGAGTAYAAEDYGKNPGGGELMSMIPQLMQMANFRSRQATAGPGGASQ